MHQHHAARRQGLEGGEQRVEAHAAGGRVVVGIGFAAVARALEHGAVVVPGRVGQVDAAVGEIALQEVRADLEAAAGTHALDGGDAAGLQRRVLGAEQQALHGAAEVGGAFHRQVGPRAGRLDDGQFGRAHRGQHGNAAVVVEIDADGQVDLAGAGVLLEGLVEAQDGITGVGIDVLEHGNNSVGEPRLSERPTAALTATAARGRAGGSRPAAACGPGGAGSTASETRRSGLRAAAARAARGPRAR
mmetsp:Transcript_21970/g.86250  ORF Transcript_21970/g.86250 Transcript_21970/m.86250 type:complete len:246 (-) Transcript_21970:313-1050(-)